MIRIRYVVEFTFTTIQGNLEIDTLSICYQLRNENTLCSLVVDGWCTIVFSEMPGSRSPFCEVENIEFIRLEYWEHTDEIPWCLVFFAYFIFISCAIHPMVERVTLQVKGLVLWNDKQVTGFHPCCLRRSTFCLISGIVGDVIGILHLLEADLQIAVVGDVAFQYILGSDTVGCEIVILSRLIVLCLLEIKDRILGCTVVIHLQQNKLFSVLIQCIEVKNLVQFISLLSVERYSDAFTLMECQTTIFQLFEFVVSISCNQLDILDDATQVVIGCSMQGYPVGCKHLDFQPLVVGVVISNLDSCSEIRALGGMCIDIHIGFSSLLLFFE